MSNMSTLNTQTLTDIFRSAVFRIPDYQRGYAWEEKHLKDFWQDLTNLEGDASHYTGLLTLDKIAKETVQENNQEHWLVHGADPVNMYHVVDGQQRLTTFIIFLQCLVDKLKEKNEQKNEKGIMFQNNSLRSTIDKYLYLKQKEDSLPTYKFGYTEDHPSHEYLIQEIFRTDKFEDGISDTLYTKNLKFAQKFFNEKLGSVYEESGEEKLGDFFKKFTQNLKFNLYIIDKPLDAYVTFEVINHRGKGLSTLEILKNRILYVVALRVKEGSEDSKDFECLPKKVNNAWKKVYHQLGRVPVRNISKGKEEKINDDVFLSAHESVFRKKSSKSSASKLFEETLKAFSVEKKPKVTCSEIEKYAESIENYSRYWFYSFFPFEAKEEELTDEVKRAVEGLNRICIDIVSFRPLVTLVLSKRGEGNLNIVDTLKSIERFVLIALRLYKRRSDYGKGIVAAAHRYREQEGIQKNIASSIERRLGEFMEGGEVKANAFSEFYGSIESSLVNKNASQGNTTRTVLKHILTVYEICKNPKSTMLLEDFTLEHVYPQNPKNQEWPGFKDLTENKRKQYALSLGNLLLLKEGDNSGLGNSCYAKKRESYKKLTYSSEELAEKYESWAPKAIKERGEALIDFMEEHWRFKFPKDERKEMLGLHDE